MKIRFWGVRGSIPSPGPKTARFGGNTTCIELRTDDNDLIILDGGSGIFPLAQTLLSQLPVTCHIFLTHTHWDHIQGLPFFIPFFIPGNKIHIHGAFDPIHHRDIKEILSRQMEYCYFPVRESELKAEIHYTTLREGQTIQVGNAKVSNILMNHPVLNFGYKVEADGKTFFFTGDHEPPVNIYAPEDQAYAEYETLLLQRDRHIHDFFHGADLLVADSAYNDTEYKSKIGWGHGTYTSCLKMARLAQVKRLIFTHHEPTRSDEALEKLFSESVAGVEDISCHLAQEGAEFTV